MAKLTINQVSIENLGPFREKQVFDLSIKNGRPVILVKALNGSGKTTLLTALQIVMYGYRAINQARRSEYDQLVNGLQRHDATGNSVVELTLSIEIGSSEKIVTIRREWFKRGKNLSEEFSVFSDDILDLDFTEDWDEFINGILPVELVNLFLFDGEKIESLANPERLPALLKRATEVFLGLGGIDALANDLRAIERRAGSFKKDKSNEFTEMRTQVDTYSAEISAVTENIAILIQQHAGAQVNLDNAQRKLDDFTIEAKRKGLSAYQQAAHLQATVKAAELRNVEARSEIIGALENPILPLSWLGPLWSRYKEQWKIDEKSKNSGLLLDAFSKRDERILKLFSELSKNNNSILSDLFKNDRLQFQESESSCQVLMSGETPDVIDIGLSNAIDRLSQSLMIAEKEKLNFEKAKELIGRIPAEQQLADVFEELKNRTKIVSNNKSKLQEVGSLLADAQKNKIHLESRLNSVLQRLRLEFKKDSLEIKSLDAAERAKKTLLIFRERLLASKANWLAEMITIEFQKLLRKKNLISKVLVEPTSYAVSIEDGSGHILPMERLSAGERQLLAISVLSALIRERKGRFPVVVDTPLARLDRNHREALIHTFFAKVSHQVLILSTDEEVEGNAYNALKKHMNREYELNFDDGDGSSIVKFINNKIINEVIS
jgi:DNA sulfur modification protein DndD